MRSRDFTMLIAAALCVCAAAAERPTPFSSDDVLIVMTGAPSDPNQPVSRPAQDPNQIWDPAQHITATWESISMSMTSQLYNPAVRPDQTAKGPQWSLSLVTKLNVIDSNGLLGLTMTTGSAEAFDQDGRQVSSTPATDQQSRWYLRPHYATVPTGAKGEWVTEMFPNHFSVSLPMDPNAKYPSLLSRVEWSMYALVADQFKTVDVPFKASDTWVELAPGLEILVEKAVVEDGKYQYTIKAKWNTSQADYVSGGSVHLWRDEKPPATIVVNMSILDATGKPIQGGGGFSSSGSYSGSGDLMTGTNTGTGNCAVCGNATTIRYTLAFNAHEKEVRLTLENVPVPSF